MSDLSHQSRCLVAPGHLALDQGPPAPAQVMPFMQRAQITSEPQALLLLQREVGGPQLSAHLISENPERVQQAEPNQESQSSSFHSLHSDPQTMWPLQEGSRRGLPWILG